MREAPIMESQGDAGLPLQVTDVSWLHLTPRNISLEVTFMAETHTWVKFPANSLTIDLQKIDSNFKVTFFDRRNRQWWKDTHWLTTQQYKESVYAWHEEYAGVNGFTMKMLLDMSNITWKIYSSWKETDENPGHYHRVAPNIKDLMQLPIRDLLLAVRRENPHWYKLHPCPNLQEDRWNVDPEKFACDTYWWYENVRKLKSATVAYITKFIDDNRHCDEMPKTGSNQPHVPHLPSAD